MKLHPLLRILPSVFLLSFCINTSTAQVIDLRTGKSYEKIFAKSFGSGHGLMRWTTTCLEDSITDAKKCQLQKIGDQRSMITIEPLGSATTFAMNKVEIRIDKSSSFKRKISGNELKN